MSEWDLVDGNPASGDVGGVRHLGRVAVSVADAAHDAQMGVQGVASELAGCTWEGSTASAFRSRFSPLAPDLGLMASSYFRVGEALRAYATDLEVLQERARQALTRAQLAQSTAEQARPALDAARVQVVNLTRQVREVQANVRTQLVQRSHAVEPAQATALDASILRLRQYEGRLTSGLTTARQQESAQQHRLDEAVAVLGKQRSLVHLIRDDHRDAERRAADRIRASLEEGLRNAGLLEKGLVAIAQGLVAISDPVALAKDVQDQVILAIHKALTVLSEHLDKVMLVLLVVTVVVFAVAVFATGGLAAGALALLPALVKAGMALQRSKWVIDSARMATTLYLASNEVVDPTTGRAAVTWSEVADTSIDFGIGAAVGRIGGSQVKMLDKRYFFPDARYATGAWRQVRTLRPGRAFDPVERELAGLASQSVTAARDAATTIIRDELRVPIRRSLDSSIASLRDGRCSVVAGPVTAGGGGGGGSW